MLYLDNKVILNQFKFLFDLLFPKILLPLTLLVSPGLYTLLLLSTYFTVFCFNKLIRDAMSFLVVANSPFTWLN
jgi:hypothetical protein